MSHFPVENRLVVISGGSQGLGASLLNLLVSKGANVVIVARTEVKLRRAVNIANAYRANDSQSISYIVADLSNPHESTKVFQQLPTPPDIVFCCAGVANPSLFIDLETHQLQSGIDGIYKSALYFSHAAFKSMAAAGTVLGTADSGPLPPSRHIIYCSSVLAFYSFIGYGPYAPLKAAVRTLADIMRQECIPYNISVETIFPGNMKTEGFEVEEQTKPEITRQIEGPSEPIDPDDAALIVFKSLAKGKKMIHTDFIGFVLHCMSLGGSPRVNQPIQEILALLLVLFTPIWGFFINRQIKQFFVSQTSNVEVELSDSKSSKTSKQSLDLNGD